MDKKYKYLNELYYKKLTNYDSLLAEICQVFVFV